MSGKVPSRVRNTRIQRNTPKYAGNMNKEGLISCGFGRNRVICQKIKSRTAPKSKVTPFDAPTNLTELEELRLPTTKNISHLEAISLTADCLLVVA